MIVFDASTLILIAKADLLDLFLGNVAAARKRRWMQPWIQKALDESRLRTVAVKNRRLVAKLQVDFGLGKGEAEAIALALGDKAQFLGIDDKNGINACKLLGIPFTTAIGILVRSREKEFLGQAEALDKLALLAEHGRYKDSIIDDARRKLEAKP
jgi:predicted nucleic acid-binding protein